MPYRRPARWFRAHPSQTIFGVALVLIAIWSGIVTNRIEEQADRDARQEAARVATLNANYTACVGSISLLRKINAAFRGAEAFGEVLLFNTVEMHNLEYAGTARYAQQEANIARLKLALATGSGVVLPVPTKQECQERRRTALNR